MGEMTEQDLTTVAGTMTERMLGVLMSGNHYGTTVIGQKVTINALRSRGLIGKDNRWTGLGWAVALHSATVDRGWNPGYFKTLDDVHAEAIEEDARRELIGKPVTVLHNDHTLTGVVLGGSGDSLTVRLIGDGAVISVDPLNVTLAPDPVDVPTNSTWVGIDDRGSLRCRETGFIVQAIRGGLWEVLRPEWNATRQGRTYHGIHMGRSKAAALGAAGRRRPEMRGLIASDWDQALAIEAAMHTDRQAEPGFRGGKTPPKGWSPVNTVALVRSVFAQEERAAATEALTRVAKRAQYDALRAVMAEIDAWREQGDGLSPGVQQRGDLAANAFREMLASAAAKLGVRWP